MTAKRRQAEHGPAPTAKDAPVGGVSGELSDLGDSAGKRVRDTFSARRDEWLDLANVRRGLPAKTFKALYAIANFSSVRTKGFSYLSYAGLGKRTAMSESAIRRALIAAVDAGLLRVVSGADKRQPNHFWPVLNGAPLAPRVGELPDISLPSKSAVANARDGRSGKFTTAEIGAVLPPKSVPHYRRNRQRSLLRESPKESPDRATDADVPFKAFREAAKSCGVKLGPAVKKNWAADLAELAGMGLDHDAHVLPVLEYWGGQVDRLSDLRRDAEEVRRTKWAHDPANDFRIPAEVAWSDRVGELVELFQRAGWRPSEHGQLFAGCATLVEADFPCFDELDQAVELMLQADSSPAAPPAVDDLVARYQASQAAVEHPGWSFETFVAAVARFPNISLGDNFRRRWERGCADMASEGLDFEHHVLPSLGYRASWGHGSAAVLRDGYDVQFFAEGLRDLCWLRNTDDPSRIPDDLPITKYTRRAYELFQLAGWRPTEHPEVFATFNDRFSSGPFADCWHTIEFVIANGTLRDEPVPLAGILAAHERDREKILAWRIEGGLDEDVYHDTLMPIDPRVEARLCIA